MWGWLGPRACLGDERNLLPIPGFEPHVRRAHGLVNIRSTVPGLLLLWRILFLRLKYLSLVSGVFTSFPTCPSNVIALVCTYGTIYCWPYETRFDSVVTNKWSVWLTIPVTWRYCTTPELTFTVKCKFCTLILAVQLSFTGHAEGLCTLRWNRIMRHI